MSNEARIGNADSAERRAYRAAIARPTNHSKRKSPCPSTSPNPPLKTPTTTNPPHQKAQRRVCLQGIAPKAVRIER